jgi:hypothetical protein
VLYVDVFALFFAFGIIVVRIFFSFGCFCFWAVFGGMGTGGGARGGGGRLGQGAGADGGVGGEE